jgi:UDP-GlcNAc3NAcA epimerase
LSKGEYLLATVHRAENTDNLSRLRSILAAFDALKETVIFPVHPRTRKVLTHLSYVPAPHVRLIEPVGYLDMVMLEQDARMIMTDSGGIQKEAYWLGVPCVTLRDETEWVETVQAGWNLLAGADSSKITEAVERFSPPDKHPVLYGDGKAAGRCVELLRSQ